MSAIEMRNVVRHAGDSLSAALSTDGQHLQRVAAMAYAKGVLDLLATYLVDAEPAQPTTPDGLRMVLLDGHGDLWEPMAGTDLWTCATESGMDNVGRGRIEERYDGAREVWVR